MNLRNNYWMLIAACGVGMLCGCDMLGIETPAKQQAAAEADGKAVGSACRRAGRAIEDCFTLNPRAPKAAVFNGWKEMNDYMTKNKIEIVAPQLAKLGKEAKDKEVAPNHEDSAPDPKTAQEKAAAKPLGHDKAGKSHDKAQVEPAAADAEVPRDSKPKIASVADDAVAAARLRAHTP